MLVKYRFVIIAALVGLAAWFILSGGDGTEDNNASGDSAQTLTVTAGEATIRWDIDTEPLKYTQLAVCGYGGDMAEFFWYKAQELYGSGEVTPYESDKQLSFANGYVQASNGTVTVFNRVSDNGYHTLSADERAATVKQFLESLGLNPAEFKETAVSGGTEDGVTAGRASVTLSQVVAGIPVEGGGIKLGFNGNAIESIAAGYKQVTRVGVKTALSVEQLKTAFSTVKLSVTGGISAPTSFIVTGYTATYRVDDSKADGKLYPYIVFEGTATDGNTHGKFYSDPILMIITE